ncbi:DMT family transporter [Streptomyces beijiangensis]|uniref:DMT family transporter n=1 Tax=Streptomyces beijiangensis TaxID=163361 RepID=A0A939JKL7_9ACTN|nr:DMT family transporter [Streptomyces beijiangensis]MBO0515957.1 DMT family transporter [Streptomyces beijiangensis]
MNATVTAVVLSLLSAIGYATAAVAQERLASRTAPSAGVLRLLRRGTWWATVGLNATGALLHVAALKYGSLTLVQPLGALTLVAAVPLGAHLAGRRVGRGEWRGTALTLAGLGALLVTAGGHAPRVTMDVPEALAVAAVAMALVAGLSRRGARPGLRFAAASGIASGVASALTQTVTVSVTDSSGPVLTWQVVLVAVLVAAFAAGGLLLSQIAYREGLGAPLAVVTLANPIAAAAIGLTLLGEHLTGGFQGVLLAFAGAAAAVRGVFLLTRTAPADVLADAPVDVPADVLPDVLPDVLLADGLPGVVPDDLADLQATAPQVPPYTGVPVRRTTIPSPPAPALSRSSSAASGT